MGSDIAELLERVETASGPDRELDAAIEVAMLGTTATDDDLIYHSVPRKDDHCAPGTFWRKSRSGASLRTAAPFTASLDNALALVEEKLPDWHWSVSRDHATHRRQHFASIMTPSGWDGPGPWPEGFADGATPSLALLGALLKVLGHDNFRALAPLRGDGQQWGF